MTTNAVDFGDGRWPRAPRTDRPVPHAGEHTLDGPVVRKWSCARQKAYSVSSIAVVRQAFHCSATSSGISCSDISVVC